MDLKNGYKVIYERAADGVRTFYATKNTKCDPTADDEIIKAEIGRYKLIYEKGGVIYGSESGIPAESDFSFDGFAQVFVEETSSDSGSSNTNAAQPDEGKPENGTHGDDEGALEGDDEQQGDGPTFDFPEVGEENE